MGKASRTTNPDHRKSKEMTFKKGDLVGWYSEYCTDNNKAIGIVISEASHDCIYIRWLNTKDNGPRAYGTWDSRLNLLSRPKNNETQQR
jgi:hypothetical protein